MSLLPLTVDAARYFQDIHSQPLDYWQGALTFLATHHSLPDGSWERAALGRNVVFLGPSVVVKLGPPCWAGDVAREADALQHVAKRLPVRTPGVLAYGTLDGWEYLVTARCPGVNLYHLWRELGAEARVGLARQHGALMGAVHGLPVEALPPTLLNFDWRRMISGQHADLESALARSGVAPELVAQADVLSAAVDATVVVHGDLSHLNFMVEQRDGRWTITGLLDWGDVKVGPWTHELLSPGVHMYLGDGEALRAWYEAYGRLSPETASTVAHVATARAALYYAEEFNAILARLPGGVSCRDWSAVTCCLWQLDDA